MNELDEILRRHRLIVPARPLDGNFTKNLRQTLTAQPVPEPKHKSNRFADLLKTPAFLFAGAVALLIIVIIGAGPAYQWIASNLIGSNQASVKEAPHDQPTDNNDIPVQEPAIEKFDASIHEVNIKLQSEADLSQLPDYTPASFKEYMRNELRDNKPGKGILCWDEVVVQYHVYEISQVNIRGGMVPVDGNGEGCPGGGPIIWAISASGRWDWEGSQSRPCEIKNGGKVYKEFMPECYKPGSDSMIENPNGSIKSLSK